MLQRYFGRKHAAYTRQYSAQYGRLARSDAQSSLRFLEDVCSANEDGPEQLELEDFLIMLLDKNPYGDEMEEIQTFALSPISYIPMAWYHNDSTYTYRMLWFVLFSNIATKVQGLSTLIQLRVPSLFNKIVQYILDQCKSCPFYITMMIHQLVYERLSNKVFTQVQKAVRTNKDTLWYEFVLHSVYNPTHKIVAKNFQYCTCAFLNGECEECTKRPSFKWADYELFLKHFNF